MVRGCLPWGLAFGEESSRFGRSGYSEEKLSSDALGRIGCRVCASINPSTRPTAQLNQTSALPELQSAVACTLTVTLATTVVHYAMTRRRDRN